MSFADAKRLDEVLSAEVKGHEHSPRFKASRWDGRRHFFRRQTGTFPTGLVPRVKKFVARDLDAEIGEVSDLRPPRLEPDLSVLRKDAIRGMELRDYQLESARKFLKFERGVVWAATNSGKQAIASVAIKAFPKASILYLIHKKVLLRQARSDIAAHLGLLPEHVGVIGEGAFNPARITVATVQSIHRKLKQPELRSWLWGVGLVILDESHHARATTFADVMNAVGARWRLGLSGTPFADEASKMMLEACVGRVIARVTNADLVARGISAKPTIVVSRHGAPDLEGSWEWQRVYRDGVVQNAERNAAVLAKIKLAVGQGRQTLAMVSQTWHGELLSAMLKVEGISHRFIHGQLPSPVIDDAMSTFEERGVRVLVATPLIDEGVNLPAIGALVIADGGKSVRKILQQVGRSLRKKKEGANVVEIYDFDDRHHLLLEKHSEERIAIYRGEGFDVIEEAA